MADLMGNDELAREKLAEMSDGPIKPHAEEAKQTTEKRFSLLKLLYNIVSTLLFLAFLAALFYLVSSRDVQGMNIGPYKALNVLTGSMEPTIRTGSVIVIKEVLSAELSVGDIITYVPSELESILLTHRIVASDPQTGTFITRGDANNTDDISPVHGDQIIGKFIFSIPFLGALSNYLRTPAGIASAVVICLAFLLVPKLLKFAFKALHNA